MSAGLFSQPLQDDKGNAQKLVAYTVTNLDGTAAATFTDQALSIPTGALYTTNLGMAKFWIQEGYYNLTNTANGHVDEIQVVAVAPDRRVPRLTVL